MSPKALTLTDLAYSLPAFTLRVDLDLGAGEFGLLLGPSGCGKTTTLRLLAGLLKEESGSIKLGDRELCGLAPERRRVGLVFQDFALFPHLSVRRNIEYGPRLAGVPRRERRDLVEALAESLHIGGLLDRHPEELSGGEQQRAALARSLAAAPDLLLLDEPLSSLDPGLRRELRTEIRERIKAAGIPALQVSHDLEEALALGDRIFVMEAGRILESGSPRELWEAPAKAFTARLLGRGPVLPLQALTRVEEVLVARTGAGSFPLGPEALGPKAPEFEVGGAEPGASLFLPGPFAVVDGPGPGRLLGRVESSSYEGDAWRVVLRTEAGSLEVQVLADQGPRVGESLALGSSALPRLVQGT